MKRKTDHKWCFYWDRSEFEGMNRAFDYEHIYDEGLPVTTLRLYLIKMIDDFIDLQVEAIERNEPFRLRGL